MSNNKTSPPQKNWITLSEEDEEKLDKQLSMPIAPGEDERVKTLRCKYRKLAVEYGRRASAKIMKLIREKSKTELDKDQLEIMTNLLMDSVYKRRQTEFGNITPLNLDIPHFYITLRAIGLSFDAWLSVVNTIPFYHSLGDTLGYYNGNWEFNYMDPNAGPEYTNDLIYEFISLGGVNDISIVNWSASDDTVLYMATYDVLVTPLKDIDDYGKKLRLKYLEALPNIINRGIGNITERSLNIQQNIEWDKLPYNSMDIGNGSAMRAGCIGIFYPGSHNRNKLIALAVECSRITHNSTIAILGSVVAALFTAYAIERIPINFWPHKLLKLLKSDRIDNYMKKSRPNEYHLYLRDKITFVGPWEKYVSMRFAGLTPNLNIKMLKNPVQRIKYLAENFSKGHMNFPGSCGDDVVIMAYDALLESGNILEKLIVYAILHPGDSDTVGAIAMSWFGASYFSLRNFEIVNKNFKKLEFYRSIWNSISYSKKKMTRVYFYDLLLDQSTRSLYNVFPALKS